MRRLRENVKVHMMQLSINVSFDLLLANNAVFAHQSHRRQSFSCRRRTRVERSAAARNIRILSVYFLQTSEDSSLPALLPLTVCVVPEQ